MFFYFSPVFLGNKMTYSVYVGNLATTVSTEQLTNLFSQVGEVLDVWINPLHERITYGFVKFCTEIATQKACEQFNGLKLDYSEIKVNFSMKNETESSNKLSNQSSYTNRHDNDSILLELPKTTRCCNNHLALKKLLKTLRRNKDIQRL